MQKEFDEWFYGFYGQFSFRIEYFYEDCEIEIYKLANNYFLVGLSPLLKLVMRVELKIVNN